ncbi:S1 RNA-binding domain-containing protein [Intestinimonas butyriciproducens]|uniref:S1 RNA-binding domain-containing protein n=1 Tax=Intestinimonas butyriciproducens TaxID=1297617 RepID=UPI00189F1AB8|nr:S1 RNA-binding domain-containing protein [Intestinimonas butyriciproducens]
MAIRKKELLEQETPIPEATSPAGDAAASDETEIPAALPAEDGDLNDLLASMDHPDDEEDGSSGESGGLPELTEQEMFGEAPADGGGISDTSEAEATAALEAGADEEPVTEAPDILGEDQAEDPVLSDGDGESGEITATLADDAPPANEVSKEPVPAKPKRASRRKKSVSAEDAAAEAPVPPEGAVPEETLPQEDSAETEASPTVETPADETAAPAREAPAESQPEVSAPASGPRRAASQRRSDPSILTIRNRDEVETEEDREDVIWHEIHNAYRTRRILTGQLGGMEQLDNRKTVAIVDYKGFRILIPLKEMMINLGRSPSGQEYADLMLRQNKILGNMLGADIDFVVRGIDSKTRSVVASRREAMMRKRQTFYFDLDSEGMYRVYEGRIVQARVIAVAEKVIRIEAFGVECSILARDLAWDWIGDAHERFSVGDEVLVRILNVRRNSLEDLSIRADIKSTSENTDRDNLQKCRIQGKYAGKVTDVHKGVVYVRLANGVNAVAHSCYDYRMPGKKDDVSFAVTHLDVERGIALGIITRIIRQNL